MKNLLCGLLLFTILSPGLASDIPANYFQHIRLVIDENTTPDDLARMQEFLDDNGYSMEIKEIEYHENGKLKRISGVVDMKKSKGNFEVDDMRGTVIIIEKTLSGGLNIDINTDKVD